MKALYEEANLEPLVSCCESLETPQFRRRIPGRSLHTRKRSSRIAWHILGSIGFQVECAYDTITIGTKRPVAQR